MHNTVSLIHVCLDAHKQHQTERMGWEKTNFSPADITQCCKHDFVCWFVCLFNNLRMCSHHKLCIIVHFLYTTCLTSVSLHSPVFLCLCLTICIFVGFCVNQQCRLPFYPIPLSIAVMLPRDDKPFSGASWQGWWGGWLLSSIALEVTGAIATLCAPLRRDIVTGVEWRINLPVSPRDSKINTQTYNNWCVIKAWSMIVE